MNEIECIVDFVQTAILGAILWSQSDAGKKIRNWLIRYRNWRKQHGSRK